MSTTSTYWNEQVEIMQSNLKKLQAKLKRDQVVSMSRRNAEQIVPTIGITVRADAFGRLMDEAFQCLPFFTS